MGARNGGHASPKARWHQRGPTRDYKTPAAPGRPSPPYTFLMPLDIAAVQASLAAAGLDGWLLYDFHGSNPIAQSLAGLTHAAKMTTRRWYYYIPADGEPRGLVHAIERHNLDGLPGTMQPYAGRASLDEGLDALLAGASPNRDGVLARLRYSLPIARGCRDARVGTRSAASPSSRPATWCSSSRRSGRRPRSPPMRPPPPPCTGSRIGRSRCCGQVATGGQTTTEYALQQQMVGWFADEGLVSSDPPVVAVMANAGNPHYLPTASSHQPIGRDQLVLLDLWGKQAVAGCRVRRHHVGGLHGRDGAARDGSRLRRHRPSARHGGEHRPGRPRRRPVRARIRGRSRRARGAGARWVCGRDLASHRP